MSRAPAGARLAVRLAVWWGDQCVLTRMLTADRPRTFEVGSAQGCDLAVSARDFGAPRHVLLELDDGRATLLLPPLTAGALAVDGAEASTPLVDTLARAEQTEEGHRALELQPGETVRFTTGALTYEVRWVRAPRQVPVSPFDGFDYLAGNVALAVTAAAVAIILSAQFSVLEDEPDDAFTDAQRSKVVKVLVRTETRKAARSAADAPQPRAPGKEGRLAGPVAKTPRSPKSSAPVAPVPPGVRAQQLLSGVFAGRALDRVLDDDAVADLRAATAGLQVATRGEWAGLGGSGLGLKGDGLGGGNLDQTVRIGGLSTRGRGNGENDYGRGGPCVGKACAKDQTGPKFEVGPVVVCGKTGVCLDKNLVRQAIQRNLPAIRYCFEEALQRKPSLGGRVQVRFAFGPSGVVQLSEVEQSSVGDSIMEACIASRVRLIQFPRRPEGTGLALVHYPFQFRRAGETSR